MIEYWIMNLMQSVGWNRIWISYWAQTMGIPRSGKSIHVRERRRGEERRISCGAELASWLEEAA